ncbi:AEC family transporter [Rhodobacteraceae bacterium]|nr:AEC family transporter [Paracoccaceae bacterium]
MFEILSHDILPVFSMMVLGFILGRIKIVSKPEATTLNRIAFLVLQPALIFPLINGVDLSELYFDAIVLYGLAQAVVFLFTLLLGILIFKCSLIESWLLAMATVFVNSLLYIWPISSLIYGNEGNMPITAIVAWDASFTFAFFIITTDLLANKRVSMIGTLGRLIRNPVLIFILLGLLTNLLGIAAPESILVAFKFAGAGAAPLTLFALGVILSGHPIWPTKKITVVSIIKLFGLPLTVSLFLTLGERPILWNDLLLLNSAGPAGAMAFALAMLYKVKTDTIAPVIIWTSLLTLISLAWLA